MVDNNISSFSKKQINKKSIVFKEDDIQIPAYEIFGSYQKTDLDKESEISDGRKIDSCEDISIGFENKFTCKCNKI